MADTLHCDVCGDRVVLDDRLAVEEAQIIVFVDAHYFHDETQIRLSHHL